MDTFQKACELAAYYQVGDVNGLIEGIAQALASEREAALEECDELLVVSKRVLDAIVKNPDKMSGSLMDELEAAIIKFAAIRALKAVGVNQAAG